MPAVLRTPDVRFAGISDFPYPPHYIDRLPGYAGMRMHYVDAGPPDSETVFLCLHGQPTWAYLFRRMIPVFVNAGHRALAPDLFGFGRSDKPVDDETYTFDFHRDSLKFFLEALDLRNVCLVVQDWGGLLGLTLPIAMPERITRLLVMNTMLATGDPLPQGFLAWREWANQHPDLEVGKLLGRACPHLTPAERDAYDAPFPDLHYKAGVRRFPNLVAEHPDSSEAVTARAARDWLRTKWRGDSFMAIGMQDPVLGVNVMRALNKEIRGCPAPMEVREAGHFVQEWGARIAANALAHFFPY